MIITTTIRTNNAHLCQLVVDSLEDDTLSISTLAVAAEAVTTVPANKRVVSRWFISVPHRSNSAVNADSVLLQLAAPLLQNYTDYYPCSYQPL